MKSKFGIFIIILLVALFNSNAQDVTTVTVKSTDISDNLDLEAVASLFGDAENLEDFERMLNDPELQISNLDLNKDGIVDYLRVLETSSGETHLIIIQAVLGEDQYQDIATIDVEKDDEGNTQVRVVGDVYMYGSDYVIVPVYVHRPRVVVWFWGPYYSPYYSPYYYGYYPPYYHPWNPYPVYKYRRNVVVHKNENISYRRTIVKRSPTSVKLHNQIRRNDYGSKNPNKSFTNRNVGVRNKQELIQKRKSETINNPKPSRIKESSSEQIKVKRKSNIENKENKSKIRDNRNSVPSEKSKTVKQKSKSREKPPTKTTKQESEEKPQRQIKK